MKRSELKRLIKEVIQEGLVTPAIRIKAPVPKSNRRKTSVGLHEIGHDGWDDNETIRIDRNKRI